MKKSGKFSLEKVPLNPMEMKILKLLFDNKEGTNQKVFTQKLNTTIGAVSKALNRLIKKALIYSIAHPIKIYRINPDREKEIDLFITGYDYGKNSNLIVDAHAYVFKAKTNKLPDKFLNKLKEKEGWIEYHPKNWLGSKKVSIDGTISFHVTKKDCFLYFYFRTFASNQHIADMINKDKMIDKKNYLEEKYPGLKIGNIETVAKCPWAEIALLKHPLSLISIKLGFKHKSIEDSHRIGGEIEMKGPNALEKINMFFALWDEFVKNDFY